MEEQKRAQTGNDWIKYNISIYMDWQYNYKNIFFIKYNLDLDFSQCTEERHASYLQYRYILLLYRDSWKQILVNDRL